MLGPRLLILTTLLAFVGVAGHAQDTKPVVVTVDVTETPDLADWGAEAGRLCKEWHPKIAALLASDGFTPPTTVKLVFQKDKPGVAGTAGKTIYIAAKFVREHRDDYGLVIHELVHVIQAYPKYDHGWLVEGIADYVRFYHFEPAAKLPPIDRAKARYRDGYKTAAQFLAWIVEKHDKQLIGRLNATLRRGEYEDDLFKDVTGRTLDELWGDFLQTPEALRGR